MTSCIKYPFYSWYINVHSETVSFGSNTDGLCVVVVIDGKLNGVEKEEKETSMDCGEKEKQALHTTGDTCLLFLLSLRRKLCEKIISFFLGFWTQIT